MKQFFPMNSRGSWIYVDDEYHHFIMIQMRLKAICYIDIADIEIALLSINKIEYEVNKATEESKKLFKRDADYKISYYLRGIYNDCKGGGGTLVIGRHFHIECPWEIIKIAEEIEKKYSEGDFISPGSYYSTEFLREAVLPSSDHYSRNHIDYYVKVQESIHWRNEV